LESITSGEVTFGKFHKERAVIGRIFQALPTQTDTITVAFIYKIGHHFSYKQKKFPLLCLTTTIWIPSSIAIIAWTHTCGAFYGMSPKYCTLLWYVPSFYWG
jgi:hypothetical protein